MITSPVFAGKRYAVLGLARSGLAAVETLLASGAQVTAWDAREEPRLTLAANLGESVELLDPATGDLVGFDAVVVSPGIPLARHPIAEAAARAEVPVIGDIELFAQARPTLPPHRVVGITGTNGKSTTTALVAHLLESAGVPVRIGGNIGVPILGEDELTPNEHGSGVYVLELSSYQLDLTESLDCDVAALLNITPDHLDRHGGFEGYVRAKARIFSMQSPAHQAIFGRTDVTTLAIAAEAELAHAPGAVRRVDGSGLAGLQSEWPSLQGPHNLQNAAVAVAIVEALGLEPDQWLAAMPLFRGLPHRLERVAEAGGVIFINDSKATNPASTAPALAAFPPNPDPRIHWILGGLPKGEGLDECAPWFGHIAAAYVIGEAGPTFAELLAPHMKVHRSELMAEAIRQAIATARPGDVVMLSPACASFDQFRDYEARGDAFRLIVESYLAQGTVPGGSD
ncbi:MAG: UDP-N-acetylmuramoyl-L-alanine--D-glutamate ligase [Novosphingobium sp.]